MCIPVKKRETRSEFLLRKERKDKIIRSKLVKYKLYTHQFQVKAIIFNSHNSHFNAH